jgi:endonuclease/exonuclease/phosphatase family metal-dependent hydrolase
VDLRVLTLNLWGTSGDWAKRRAAIAAGVRALDPDLIALQEVVKTQKRDTAAEVVGEGYSLHHQTIGRHGGELCIAIACRWPVAEVREIDHERTPRMRDFPVGTLLAEVKAPRAVGPLLFVNHLPAWELAHELERERQTVAAARLIEEIVSERPMHVVLAGDLDAVPEAASIRFLRGLQSIDGVSVCFRDAWEAVGPGEVGHTFTTDNPLMLEDSEVRQELNRRIDYIFVRCDEYGPTLGITSCSLAFDRPLEGVRASDHFGVVADLAASPAHRPPRRSVNSRGSNSI